MQRDSYHCDLKLHRLALQGVIRFCRFGVALLETNYGADEKASQDT